MISCINIGEAVDYTLRDDKKNPTVWQIGSVPSDILARVSTQQSEYVSDISYQICQVGLKGWKNLDQEFRTEAQLVVGKQIEVVPMELLGKLSIKVVQELAGEICKVNKLTDDEAKN